MTEDQRLLIQINERLVSLTKIVESGALEQDRELEKVWAHVDNLRIDVAALTLKVSEHTLIGRLGKAVLFLLLSIGAGYFLPKAFDGIIN
jgi:hypothetical protein